MNLDVTPPTSEAVVLRGRAATPQTGQRRHVSASAEQRRAAPLRRPMAYKDIADNLLQRIATGQLVGGDRLPGEIELAEEYGVSRTTVREALRLLDAQDLILTKKGASGGSFIRVPRVSRINEFLFSSIGLLTGADHVSIDDLLEAREVLEVPAARLAAGRRTQSDIERLHDSIPASPGRIPSQEQFSNNREFHTTLIDTCGNALLSIAAQPVFGVLMASVSRDSFGTRFNRHVIDQHASIAKAIETGDAAAAGDLMHEHLEYLRPAYIRAWHQTARRKS